MGFLEDGLFAVLDFFLDIGDSLQEILPLSPFLTLIYSVPEQVSDVLGFVNWFVPVSDMINIWLSYIGFYIGAILIMAVLRYFRILSE